MLEILQSNIGSLSYLSNLSSYHKIDEESVAMEEVKALGEAVQEVELSIGSTDVDAALDSRSLIHRNQSF